MWFNPKNRLAKGVEIIIFFFSTQKWFYIFSMLFNIIDRVDSFIVAPRRPIMWAPSQLWIHTWRKKNNGDPSRRKKYIWLIFFKATNKLLLIWCCGSGSGIVKRIRSEHWDPNSHQNFRFYQSRPRNHNHASKTSLLF